MLKFNIIICQYIEIEAYLYFISLVNNNGGICIFCFRNMIRWSIYCNKNNIALLFTALLRSYNFRLRNASRVRFGTANRGLSFFEDLFKSSYRLPKLDIVESPTLPQEQWRTGAWWHSELNYSQTRLGRKYGFSG
jgi:hypothetical protein